MEVHSLGTSSQFDTFGFTAAERARKQAEKEQQQRYCEVLLMSIAQWGMTGFTTSLKLHLVTFFQ